MQSKYTKKKKLMAGVKVLVVLTIALIFVAGIFSLRLTPHLNTPGSIFLLKVASVALFALGAWAIFKPFSAFIIGLIYIPVLATVLVVLLPLSGQATVVVVGLTVVYWVMALQSAAKLNQPVQ